MQDRAGYKSMSISAGALRVESTDGTFAIADDTKLGETTPTFTLSIETDKGFQHIRLRKEAAERLMGWLSCKEDEYRQPKPKATP